MTKTKSLTRNNDFRRLYARGKSVVDKNFVLYYHKNRYNETRLGLTVSVKLGNAVFRSRCKRLLRESYRLLESDIVEGYDFVLVARSRLAAMKCQVVTAALKRMLKAEGLLNEEASST